MTDCIFCKIIAGDIPSIKIYESDNIYAFMDINPLSKGHCLFIPKKHAETLAETDNEALSEILIMMKKVANILDLDAYNVLQNNGKLAHQVVMHTHFHLIPKPDKERGLKIGWEPISDVNQQSIAEKIIENL